MNSRRISHYRIIERLGRGGMGEVFLAEDETLGRRVALKSIRAEHRLDAATRARFRREARTLSRLEHRNICRIFELVEHEDGDFIVLELIEGEDLHDAIDRGLDHGRALDVAAQIVEALVAAHAAGIVHRDLKPSNVRLTQDGTVKVLDFGLARPIDDTSAAAASPPPSGPTGASREPAAKDGSTDEPTEMRASGAGYLTEPGSTIGTWRYMSPEQARGEPPTSAGDMFAFGLVLHELLAERPPYPDDLPPGELVEWTLEGRTLAATGVRSDLSSLIERLKSPAPSLRPTAVETAERLRFARERSRRLWRRAAAAGVLLAVGGATLKYTIDLSHANATAEQRRVRAEDLVEFLLTDFHGVLKPEVSFAALDAVGERAAAYFASLEQDELDDDRQRLRYATLLSQMGVVRLGQERYDEALELLGDALRRVEELTPRLPDRRESTRLLGDTRFYVGSVYYARGNLGAALEWFEKYRLATESLAALDPENADFTAERAMAHTNLAAVHKDRGDHDAAIREIEASLAIKEALRNRETDPARKRDRDKEYANGLAWKAVVLDEMGRLHEAIGTTRDETEIRLGLSASNADDREAKHQLAIGHQRLGSLLERVGRDEEAIREYRADLQISAALVELDPANAEYRLEHAKSQRTLGLALIGRDRADEAGALFRASLATQAEFADADPSNAEWRLGLARAHEFLARHESVAGRPDAALAAAARSFAILDGLPDEIKTAPRTRWRLAEALVLQGEIHGARGDAKAARSAHESARAAVGDLPATTTDNAGLETLARMLVHIGESDRARDVVTRLKGMGYARREFVAFCADNGL